MSLKIYSRNPVPNALVPLEERYVLRCTITLACFKGNTRVHQSSKFSVYGETMQEAIDNAVILAEAIEEASDGVMVGLETKLGHYIKDVALAEITSRQMALTYRLKSLDNTKSTSVRIPFLRADLSPTQVDALIAPFVQTVCHIQLAPDGSSLNYWGMNSIASSKMSRWDKEDTSYLVPTGNVADGGTDGYAGQD